MLVYAPTESPLGENWSNPYSAMGDERLDERATALTSKTKDISFLQIKGEVERQNSHGYLSAEDYPLLKFYMVMAVVYLVIDAIWVSLCIKHYAHMILLHHFLSMILLTQTVQSLFQVIEYTIMNKYGTLLFSFIFISLLFSVMRNTFGRVLTLLVSLGTGITRP
jgi:K+-sensing histidine kinase KdpD